MMSWRVRVLVRSSRNVPLRPCAYFPQNLAFYEPNVVKRFVSRKRAARPTLDQMFTLKMSDEEQSLLVQPYDPWFADSRWSDVLA